MDTIKDILLQQYPSHVGYKARKPINYPCTIQNSDFSLYDTKACESQRCPNEGSCDHKVMNVKTHTPVAALAFEMFVNQFGENNDTIKGGRCDYMLYDPTQAKSTIAFCELTCCDTEYIEPNLGRYPEGKRARAYSQVKNSLEHLLEVPVLDQNILIYAARLCVFGWREKSEPADDKVLESLADFTDTPSSNEAILYTEDFALGYGFRFVQVKYPTALILQ